MTVFLDPDDVELVARLGRDRAPQEACGMILPTPHPATKSRVVELPNRSRMPEIESVLEWEDAGDILREWLQKEHPGGVFGTTLRESVVFWHTHPRGNIGPSEVDLRTAEPGVQYLVVALTGDSHLPTQYWARELQTGEAVQKIILDEMGTSDALPS